MYVLPLIELQNGESVHVLEIPGQGESRPLTDPVEVAKGLSGMGARGFHIVDVDRAKNEGRDNDQALVDILDHTAFPVEAGGGVRSMKRIQELLDTGARRALVGTMGILNPDWLKEAALIFRERLLPCIDLAADRILVKGRTEPAPESADAALGRLDKLDLRMLHATFLGDGKDSVARAVSLAKRLRTPLTYQGPATGPADLARLADAGIHGAVIGAELYDGRLSLTQLVKSFNGP